MNPDARFQTQQLLAVPAAALFRAGGYGTRRIDGGSDAGTATTDRAQGKPLAGSRGLFGHGAVSFGPAEGAAGVPPGRGFIAAGGGRGTLPVGEQSEGAASHGGAAAGGFAAFGLEDKAW